MTPETPFLLPSIFDYTATFVWALSSALLAARRGYAILGIATLALVCSTGGGLLRDSVFIQNGPPALLRSPDYLWLIAVAVCMVMVAGRRVDRIPHLSSGVMLIDAIGLGAYAVVGMDRALAAGISLPGVVLVGMVNAVGGGVIRDVLINHEPAMFKPGTLEESLALIGCILFLVLTQFLSVTQLTAALVTIGVVFFVRLGAIRFQIESRPLKDFESYWSSASSDWRETKREKVKK